jgi:hypothetical protein
MWPLDGTAQGVSHLLPLEASIRMTTQYVAAIDQGTTSSRCIIFDYDGRIVSVGQREHRQIFPQPGWVEHDAAEIWDNVKSVVGKPGWIVPPRRMGHKLSIPTPAGRLAQRSL